MKASNFLTQHHQLENKFFFLVTLLFIVTILSSCNANEREVKTRERSNSRDSFSTCNYSPNMNDSENLAKQMSDCNGNVFIDSGTINISVPLTLLDSIFIGPGSFETFRYIFESELDSNISIEIYHEVFYDSWGEKRYKYIFEPENKASYKVSCRAKSMKEPDSKFQLISIDSIVDYRQIGIIDYKVKKTGLYQRRIYVLSPKKDKWINIKCQYDNSDLGLKFRDSLTQITQSICW